MKRLTSTLLLLALLPLQLFCQMRISGTITDKQSQQPVDYASVYINGTTNGTHTDSQGNYHLDNVRFPCTLVVSHLSYVTQSMELAGIIASPFNFSLALKMNEISAVNITDKNLRERNMNFFRDEFLGTDEWGIYANLENEEAILFSRDYKQRTIDNVIYPKRIHNIYLKTSPEIHWSEDSTTVTFMESVNLKARSLEPLIINLPQLGYTLYYDLLEFKAEYQKGLGTRISMLGHYYFKPIPFNSKEDSIQIAKNRIKAYYNSPNHFCKSLYENRLAQNGYKLEELVSEKKFKKLERKKLSVEDRLNSCIQVQEEDALVIGQKDKKYIIRYYKNLNNKPIDLTRHMGIFGGYSEVIFKKDTCLIRKDGTLPYNSIVFGKAIGSKRVGSLLPYDYKPAK